MAAITTYDGLIARAAAQYTNHQHFWGEVQTATGVAASNNSAMQRCGYTAAMPSLPTGVTSFIPTDMQLVCSTGGANYMVAHIVNLGTLNLASGFSAGSSMPTLTELNVSRVVSGPVWYEITTVLNATPGSFTITYTNQASTSGLTTAAIAFPASAPIRTCGWVVLNSGDTGVQSISAATQSGGSSPTGVVTFWGILPITMLFTPSATASTKEDFINTAFSPYHLAAGDTLAVFNNTTATKSLSGDIFFIGDS